MFALNNKLNSRRWVILFFAIGFLVLAQVSWWVALFLKDVQIIENLRIANAALHAPEGSPSFLMERDRIVKESSRRRFMFWSESLTFALLTCFALYLMYQLLKAEEHSKKIQKDFVDIFTHEAKTPLTALKLRLESAREKRPDPAVDRDLSLALDEIRRLTGLFENAMSLNRMERKANLAETLSLSEVIGETVRGLEPYLKAHNTELTLNIEEDLEISADPYALRNVLQNLIENGIKYNEGPDRKLWLNAKADQSGIAISVEDNGPGIASEDHPRIFDQFYRGKGKSSIPGTGLGLFLAKRIVEAHHGSIQWEPGGRGGSRFTIRLPRI